MLNSVSDFFDMVVKAAKALIVVAIAVFIARCSFMSFEPKVNIDGLADGDEIRIEVIEEGNNKTVTIKKNGEDLVIFDDAK